MERAGPPDTLALYDAIAPIYDEWQAWNGMTPFALVTAAKLAPLLEREAEAIAAHRPAPFAVLDIGCGTGALLLKLRERRPDWRLAGVDGSTGMLAAASAKPRARTVTWTRAPLAGPLPYAAEAFDAIAAFYDTMNHVLEAETLGRALAAVATVLRPGGLFAFDVTNRIGFERWWRGRNDFRGVDWRVTVDAQFDPHTTLGTAEITIVRPGFRRTFRLTERLFTEQEVQRRLAAAGFTVERADPWSPFPWDAPGKTLVVGRRRRK
jgi:SAM-dependent methyltransferase